MKVEFNGEGHGAEITDIDLRQDLSAHDFGQILWALGENSILCFPNQLLDAQKLRSFSAHFGKLQTLMMLPHEPDVPEVSILSNIVRDGKNIGIPDAGQDWHTDMTYNEVPGFVNVLVAHVVPTRSGKALGGTEFTNTRAAYDGLPSHMKQSLENATATHQFTKFYDMMRLKKGSNRPPMLESERRARPPVSHPVFLTHPISGKKVIYVNPGFVERIDGMSEEESASVLDYLYQHCLKDQYRHVHHWAVGDLLLWDHLSTWHNAHADYGPEEHRLIKRCQVMANYVWQPEFVRSALSA